ncbi:hypothetical protein KJ855_00400, partial [Patescibacteria group bacterium]|nr:hypothetical protein [Patescibacteria group bacterium]
MKKLLVFIIGLALIFPNFTSANQTVPNQDQSPENYHAIWHSQSNHIILQPLEITTVWLKFQNTGSATWYNYGDNPVRLGTSRDIDRESPFYKHTWISANRPAKLIESEVPHNFYGTFEFYVKAPAIPGTYQEYFQPLAEGITWMEDWGVYWNFTVQGEASEVIDETNDDDQYGYHAAWISQSTEKITMASDEIKTIWVEFENTGSKTWYNYDSNPVHLGTDSSRDRDSGFYKNTWLATNRAANLKETEVHPGQIGTFEFYIKAPTTPGEYYEYFTPVVENLTWIGRDGVYWIITVTNNNFNNNFTLTGNVNAGHVTLNWNKYNLTQTSSPTLSGYKIVRSEFNSNPTYPEDWWVYLSGNHHTSYTDTSVTPGHNYYYRVGAYDSNQGVVEYSNNIYLIVPVNNLPNSSDNQFDLVAASQNNGIHLNWSEYTQTLTTSNSIDGYKIVRSKYTSSPTYPDHYLTYISGQSNTDYLDTSVDPGQNYYYRIGVYKNGQIIEYSNSVHLEYTGY